MSVQLPAGRTPRDPGTPRVLSEQILRRICGEYLEMPGLRLTLHQAQRLWGLDRPTCVSLLTFLVEAKFLAVVDDRLYVRTTTGKTALPSLRMAKVRDPRPVPRRRRVGH